MLLYPLYNISIITAVESKRPTMLNIASQTGGIPTADGFTCALDGGAAKCWGLNNQGQIGSGAASPTRILSPDLVAGLNEPTWISAGDAQACAIDSRGVKCWGAYASVAQTRLTPTSVSGLSSGATDISVSQNYTTCAVQNVSAKCWGSTIWAS